MPAGPATPAARGRGCAGGPCWGARRVRSPGPTGPVTLSEPRFPFAVMRPATRPHGDVERPERALQCEVPGSGRLPAKFPPSWDLAALGTERELSHLRRPSRGWRPRGGAGGHSRPSGSAQSAAGGARSTLAAGPRARKRFQERAPGGGQQPPWACGAARPVQPTSRSRQKRGSQDVRSCTRFLNSKVRNSTIQNHTRRTSSRRSGGSLQACFTGEAHPVGSERLPAPAPAPSSLTRSPPNPRVPVESAAHAVLGESTSVPQETTPLPSGLSARVSTAWEQAENSVSAELTASPPSMKNSKSIFFGANRVLGVYLGL